ncbi:MAG: ferrous iron transport protein A [Bacteroides sp.]|nr:MAG: ferrous iron transport protein A [Bacteroides sp.]
MTVLDLSQGESGIIDSIDSAENYFIKFRLMEMGCLPGENITLNYYSPSRTSISITVMNYQLALRIEYAKYIVIRS